MLATNAVNAHSPDIVLQPVVLLGQSEFLLDACHAAHLPAVDGLCVAGALLPATVRGRLKNCDRRRQMLANRVGGGSGEGPLLLLLEPAEQAGQRRHCSATIQKERVGRSALGNNVRKNIFHLLQPFYNLAGQKRILIY